MHTKYLENAGLSDDQILVYTTLLQNGRLHASKISLLSGLKRSLVYKVLSQLSELKLVEKDSSGTITKFIPEHPEVIKTLLENRIEELSKAHGTLEANLSEMVSQYNYVSNKPNVQFFEGEEGLKKVFDDIILAKESILIFRSVYESNHTSIRELISKQIKRQVLNNIATRAITPEVPSGPDFVPNPHHDKSRLVERRVLKKKDFSLPAQIIIYGEKVGITSFKNGIFTTIIDNEDISESFKKIFDHLWDKSSNPQ